MDELDVKRVSEYQRGELAKDLLKLIRVAEQTLARSEMLDALSVIEKFRPENSYDRNRVWKAIKYLEEQNRISLTKKGNRHYMYVTEEGEMKLAEEEIYEMVVRPQKAWDKKWRMVMCEVPAILARNRALFREKILEIGFREYQTSVFLFPFDCIEDVQRIAQWAGIEDYVRVVVATEVTKGEEYKELFHL